MEPKGMISTIQKYSTKDGPGLRSTVFLVGCNLSCKWCSNPELKGFGKKIMYFKNRCVGCFSCVKAAADNSIIPFGNIVKIDREKCVNIDKMVDICPHDAYERLGYYITPHELFKKLMRDQVFYESSGGGVTFSGGEAGLQYDFVYETAMLLKKENIHVALDTAGMIPWGNLEKMLNYVDLVLYDIKAFDEEIHKKCTGVSNRLILENAVKISQLKKNMMIRMVIVPGYNDNFEDIERRLDFIQSLGEVVTQVDLLKYHSYGEGKYQALGIEYPLKGMKSCNDEMMSRILELAVIRKIAVSIGG